MKTRRVSGAESSHSGIDLAPMLDFVMNLLVFFIITAVFAKEVGIQVSRPGGGATSEGGKESKSLIVTIYGTGDVEIEGRIVDVRAVRANVERMHAVKPENGVMVVADKTVPSGQLVEVLDQIRLGGVDDISFGATK
jgi:biopolymer transport protein ExbD